MNINILPSIIKIFFIVLNSIYTYGKIIDFRFKRKSLFVLLTYSLLITSVLTFVQETFPFLLILIMTLSMTLFGCFLYNVHFSLSLCLSILSIGSTYALFTLFVLVTMPLSFLIFLCELSDTLTASIVLILIAILQTTMLFLLFQTKRLRDGIPFITNIFSKNTSVFIGCLLLMFSSAFFIDANLRLVHVFLICFCFALSLIIWLWWQKSIQTDYINKNNSQQIDLLESKLQERDAELERLSKIIHKDNKLLAALELSTRELLQDTSSEKAESLLQELNRFSKERSETLHAYEAGQEALPKTGLFSIDTMLNYLHQRALKHKIAFQLSLEDKIADITDIISEQDLCTIIADLGENAIIATKDAGTKNIRLSIERKTDGYALYFYDSGEPFAQEVLESFGKTRCTTHAETGGSGIGLVTTGELAAKYHGEFYITDADVPQPYTKCVSVILKQGS